MESSRPCPGEAEEEAEVGEYRPLSTPLGLGALVGEGLAEGTRGSGRFGVGSKLEASRRD